jgi:hypothetical protein
VFSGFWSADAAYVGSHRGGQDLHTPHRAGGRGESLSANPAANVKLLGLCPFGGTHNQARPTRAVRLGRTSRGPSRSFRIASPRLRWDWRLARTAQILTACTAALLSMRASEYWRRGGMGLATNPFMRAVAIGAIHNCDASPGITSHSIARVAVSFRMRAARATDKSRAHLAR